jgi:hypothetical protein
MYGINDSAYFQYFSGPGPEIARSGSILYQRYSHFNFILRILVFNFMYTVDHFFLNVRMVNKYFQK